MRLAHKLSLAQVMVILGLLVTHAIIQYQREVRQFDGDMRKDQRVTARALAAAVGDTWISRGRDDALRLVRDADATDPSIRIRWLPPDASRTILPPGPTGEQSDDSGIRVVVRSSADSLFTTALVLAAGAPAGAIEVGEGLVAERRYRRTSILHILATTLALGLGAGLVSFFWGAAIIVRPMEALVAQARRIGSGDLAHHLHSGHHDEISELAGQMNQMVDHLQEARDLAAAEASARIHTLDQLRHADRLATVGTLASGIAHEMGTPLNVVSGYARMIESGEMGSEQAPEGARVIREQAERMARIIRQLLDFSRRGEPDRVIGDLAPLVRQTLAFLTPLAEKHRARLVFLPGETGPVMASIHPEQIKQVLTNLVINGVQAMASGGDLLVAIRIEEATPPPDVSGGKGRYVCLEVVDSGPGIPAEAKTRIFDPFFTTKGIGEGTGLGLAVSYGIVKEHGGWIDVDNSPAAGARFGVYLPAAETATPAAS